VAFQIREEEIATLAKQAEVPMVFTYSTILEPTVVASGLGGFLFAEKALVSPRSKDYDAIENDKPSDWLKRFDVTNWGFIVARSEDDGHRIGGAVIAFDSPDAEMLEKRKDLAVLWDLRVHPDFRGERVGAALFAAVETWARDRRCVQLTIETQNNNVAACKFYAKQGCTLGAINRYAYPDLPYEIQMLWYKALSPEL
jgi:ribosomal protein S18 acetylase RimI-like enzyme